MFKNSKVAIIMATYNGGNYIDEQIKSICNQTYTDWGLFIYDDLSTDNTFEIASKWAEMDSRIKVITNKMNVGATYNFLNGLESVYNTKCYEYFMFSDQDDIWMPDKISRTLNSLYEEDGGRAVLVHTNLTLVDASGCQEIASSFKKYAHLRHIEDHIFPKLMAQPFVFGCTMMMNNDLIGQVFPIPQGVYAHDSWISLVAASAGKVKYISDPTIYFRSHHTNTSGSGNAKGFKSRLRRITKGWNEQIEITTKRIAQCEALRNHLCLTIGGSAILEDFCQSLTHGAFRTILICLKYKILRQGFFANVVYFITIFLMLRQKK